MEQQVVNGVIAVLAGLVVIVLAFVPYVAVSYRRRGRLPLGRTVLLASFVVYTMAVWAYTLLPFPDPDDLVCAGKNLRLFVFVDDIAGALQRADGRLLAAASDPAVLQLALNVLLFVPLGIFIRLLFGRGVLASAVVGLGLSAFIETTQLTGVWGLYPCAYRVFDVDDMLTNTTGAIVGSLLALALPRTWRRGASSPAVRTGPRPVGRLRRLLAMLCDLLAYTLTGLAATVIVNAYLLYVRHDRSTVLEDDVGQRLGLLSALLIWLLITLATGRTVGDLAVRIRYRGGWLPAPLTRPVRFAAGIGGYGLLELLPSDWDRLSLPFAAICLITTLLTRDGRGLPGLLSGQRPRDDVTPGAPQTAGGTDADAAPGIGPGAIDRDGAAR